ncbi:hypothetical protein RUM44_011292 [Polyplax serrata]|uniref:Uncharacterized protein n=1 Tax=Polyplax serrata TaxID=468196 RepID=A0ABR1ARC5_POLSC
MDGEEESQPIGCKRHGSRDGEEKNSLHVQALMATFTSTTFEGKCRRQSTTPSPHRLVATRSSSPPSSSTSQFLPASSSLDFYAEKKLHGVRAIFFGIRFLQSRL